MLPTRIQLDTWFAEYNRLYFSGKLPRPKLALSRSRTRLGYMQCVRRSGITGPRLSGFSIYVSVYYDCDERVYQTVLLHEMIHYYIAYFGLRDTSAHGPLFRSMMTAINKHGWHISVSQCTRGWKVREQLRSRRTRLILVIKTASRGTFVSVVSPSYALSIRRRISVIGRDVLSAEWYTSSDEEFESYSEVRSLRGRRVSAEELERLMPLLMPLDIDAIGGGSSAVAK